MTNSTCITPDYVDTLVYCILQKNFVACPTDMLIESEGCSDLRKFVANPDKCGGKIGEMYIINDYFWFGNEDESVSTANPAP